MSSRGLNVNSKTNSNTNYFTSFRSIGWIIWKHYNPAALIKIQQNNILKNIHIKAVQRKSSSIVKMKPLQTTQLLLKWLYAFPSDKSAGKSMKFAYFIFASSVIVVHFLAMVAGGIFISKLISIDLEQALFALFHTLCSFNMLYQSIATVLLRHKLAAIFKSWTKIYDESKIKTLSFCRLHFLYKIFCWIYFKFRWRWRFILHPGASKPKMWLDMVILYQIYNVCIMHRRYHSFGSLGFILLLHRWRL